MSELQSTQAKHVPLGDTEIFISQMADGSYAVGLSQLLELIDSDLQSFQSFSLQSKMGLPSVQPISVSLDLAIAYIGWQAHQGNKKALKRLEQLALAGFQQLANQYFDDRSPVSTTLNSTDQSQVDEECWQAYLETEPKWGELYRRLANS